MSRFTEWYIAESLRQLGWPKSRGFFRKRQYVDTRVLDAVVEQAIQISVGLGAGSPQRAIAVLTDTFPNNDWTKDSTGGVLQLLKEGEIKLARNPQSPPWKALYAEHRVGPHGRDVEWRDLGDVSYVTVRGLVSAQGIFWGLTHESEMPEVFANARAAYEEAAQSAIPSGVDVPARFPWNSLENFYENCERLVRDFESVRPALPEVPVTLRSRPEISRRLGKAPI